MDVVRDALPSDALVVVEGDGAFVEAGIEVGLPAVVPLGKGHQGAVLPGIRFPAPVGAYDRGLRGAGLQDLGPGGGLTVHVKVAGDVGPGVDPRFAGLLGETALVEDVQIRFLQTVGRVLEDEGVGGEGRSAGRGRRPPAG